jgi:alpha-galactosidase
MLSAPLMVGCDIRNMNETTKSILLNKDIIDIDQDPLGKQGIRVLRSDGLEVWKKQLTGDRFAIAFFNRNSQTKSITTGFKDIELDSANRFNVYDVWKHTEVGQSNGRLSATLQSHECQVFVLTPAK